MLFAHDVRINWLQRRVPACAESMFAPMDHLWGQKTKKPSINALVHTECSASCVCVSNELVPEPTYLRPNCLAQTLALRS